MDNLLNSVTCPRLDFILFLAQRLNVVTVLLVTCLLQYSDHLQWQPPLLANNIN